MDAGSNEQPSKKMSSEELAAWWAGLDEEARRKFLKVEGQQSGVPDAALLPEEIQKVIREAGECLCTTPRLNSREQVEETDGIVYFSGAFDWIEYSIDIEWGESPFATTMHSLLTKKQACQDSRKPNVWWDVPGIGPIRIHRQGMSRGGDRGQHFQFVLSIDGITLALAKRHHSDYLPNGFAQIRGRECLLIGAEQGISRVREVIDGLGGVVIRDKIGRADFCLDVSGLPVDVLQSAVEMGCFITRAKGVYPNRNATDGVGTGFHAGKRPMRLNVYDKLAELLPKGDELVLQAMKDRRWFGKLPRYAMRIEYQTGRPWLTEHGVSTVDDLFEKQGAIIKYLFEDWFRITDEPVDRNNNNQARAESAPIWNSIGEGFQWAFGRHKADLKPIMREQAAPLRLARQARGCLVKYLLQVGKDIRSLPEFAAEAVRAILATFMSEAERNKFLADFQRLKTEFGQ